MWRKEGRGRVDVMLALAYLPTIAMYYVLAGYIHVVIDSVTVFTTLAPGAVTTLYRGQLLSGTDTMLCSSMTMSISQWYVEMSGRMPPAQELWYYHVYK